MTVLAAAILSLAIGISLGLLGGGGSILTVPILVYVVGLDARPAIATSLLVVGVTSAAALVPHAIARRVSFRVGAAFGVASMAGAFTGGRLAHAIPPTVLLVAFAIMMLATGLAMLRGRGAEPEGPVTPRWGRVALSGLGIGLLTGVIGAGGGFLIVPALVLLCGLPMVSAVATSLFVIAVNSLAGFAGYLGTVAIDARVAGLVTLAAVVGSMLGSRWAGRVHAGTLRRGFAYFVLAMGVFMVGRQTSLALGAVVLAGATLGASIVTRAPRAVAERTSSLRRTSKRAA